MSKAYYTQNMETKIIEQEIKLGKGHLNWLCLLRWKKLYLMQNSIQNGLYTSM